MSGRKKKERMIMFGFEKCCYWGIFGEYPMYFLNLELLRVLDHSIHSKLLK